MRDSRVVQRHVVSMNVNTETNTITGIFPYRAAIFLTILRQSLPHRRRDHAIPPPIYGIHLLADQIHAFYIVFFLKVRTKLQSSEHLIIAVAFLKLKFETQILYYTLIK